MAIQSISEAIFRQYCSSSASVTGREWLPVPDAACRQDFLQLCGSGIGLYLVRDIDYYHGTSKADACCVIVRSQDFINSLDTTLERLPYTRQVILDLKALLVASTELLPAEKKTFGQSLQVGYLERV